MIIFGPQTNLLSREEYVKMAQNNATRQLHLGEQLDKANAQLEKALLKVEKCKGLIDALEKALEQLKT